MKTQTAPKSPRSVKKASATSPKRAPKLLIEDACATSGCTKAPAPGSSYCLEHVKPAAAAEKALEALDRANAKKAKAVESLVVSVPVAKANPKAKPVARVADKRAPRPQAPSPKAPTKEDTLEARKTIAELKAQGWTQKAIADALGTTAHRVWTWTNGLKACPEMKELGALLGKKAYEVEPKSGSLRAPVAHAARKAAPVGDSRQLVLQLKFIRDAIDTQISLLTKN